MENTEISRAELRDFYDDYAIALDDFDLDRWCGYFVEDCLYRVVSRENFDEHLPISTMECRGIAMLRDRIAALRETTVFEPRRLRHMVSCVTTTRAATGSQANFAVFECLSDRESHVLMVGRYMDKVVREGGTLKFKERVCVYDDYRIRTSLIFPV
jgi:anthranilate 1,2-dioxygenase small subunit